MQLVGVLPVPDTTPRGSVLFAHCFTCSKDPHISTWSARSLTAAGYAVLRFDFTGVGDSGGDFADKTARSVAVIAAPASPGHIEWLIAAARSDIRRHGIAPGRHRWAGVSDLDGVPR